MTDNEIIAHTPKARHPKLYLFIPKEENDCQNLMRLLVWGWAREVNVI